MLSLLYFFFLLLKAGVYFHLNASAYLHLNILSRLHQIREETGFSGRNTSDDLGFEVDGHDALDTESHGDLLEGLVGDTLLVVVLHVLEAGELGL